jgi:hypothetical protein
MFSTAPSTQNDSFKTILDNEQTKSCGWKKDNFKIAGNECKGRNL